MILIGDFVKAPGIERPCEVTDVKDELAQVRCGEDVTWRPQKDLFFIGVPVYERLWLVADQRDILEPFKSLDDAKKWVGADWDRYGITEVRLHVGFKK